MRSSVRHVERSTPYVANLASQHRSSDEWPQLTESSIDLGLGWPFALQDIVMRLIGAVCQS